jgi:hypothetical protein
MRRASKVDRNQSEIVTALRQVGATVQPLHAVGAGCPDLLVGYRGLNYTLEVKDGQAAKSGQKLTPAQIEWHEFWQGQVSVVNDVDAAFAAIGLTREKCNGMADR